MTASQHSRSSLLLVGEPGDHLRRYLHTQVPASAQWQVRSFPTVEDVLTEAPQDAPNLAVVVCPQEDALLCFELHRLLEHAKRHWPYTFFIVVSLRPLRNPEALFTRFGEMPVVDLSAASDLGAVIEREMASGTYGLVHGVSLASFLQVMAWEHKSLSIRVDSPQGWGRLHLLRGQLVQAYSNASRREGEAAALEILSWESVSLCIERSYHNGGGGELRDLQHLLMDAMKLKDEDAREDPSLLGDLLFDDDPEVGGPEKLPDLGQRPSGPVTSNIGETLGAAMRELEGAHAVSLVDYHIGMALETQGTGLDFDVAAATYTTVVRAQLQMMESLGVGGGPEDILITLKDQYHILALVPNEPLFLHLVLCRERGNLAVARSTLGALGHQLVVM